MRNTHRCILSHQKSSLPRLLRSLRHALFALPIIVLWLCAMPLSVLAQTPDVIYVDHHASGVNNGTSWDDAYDDLQRALADPAASTKEIWVAEGVYLPTSVTTDRSATFRLASGVEIYGGFAATETLRTQRDWVSHPTVLSGDIDENDYPKAGGVTLSPSGILGDNVYHVLTAAGPFADPTIVDAFTITGGCADTMENASGGGLYVTAGAIVYLTDLTVQGNYALATGGGASVSNSQATLEGCHFESNTAPGVGTYDGGGGLFVYDSVVGAQLCVFSRNETLALGGGLSVANSIDTQGTVWLYDILLSGNQAKYGGGMSSRRNDYELVNATVAGNRATSLGGGLYTNSSYPIVRNSIIWGNVPSGYNFGSSATVTYSLLQGWISTSNGNLGVDPLFVASSSSDYHLQPLSPAIDAGDPITTTLGALDLDGNPRVVDGNGINGPRVDMGAYEWPGYGLTVNVVGEGTVDKTPPGSHFPPGITVTLTAKPATGWEVGEWTGAEPTS